MVAAFDRPNNTARTWLERQPSAVATLPSRARRRAAGGDSACRASHELIAFACSSWTHTSSSRTRVCSPRFLATSRVWMRRCSGSVARRGHRDRDDSCRLDRTFDLAASSAARPSRGRPPPASAQKRRESRHVNVSWRGAAGDLWIATLEHSARLLCYSVLHGLAKTGDGGRA